MFNNSKFFTTKNINLRLSILTIHFLSTIKLFLDSGSIGFHEQIPM